MKTKLLVFLLHIFTFMAISALGADEKNVAQSSLKSVLVIHSYADESPWTQGINAGLKEIFDKSKIKVRFVPEYFTVDRFNRASPTALNLAKNKLLAKIKSDHNLDAILICDDEAADELMPSLKLLSLPIFFTGTNRPQENLTWLTPSDRYKITGVTEVYPILETLKLLKRLKPETRRISILSSKSKSSELASKIVRQQMEDKSNSTGITLGTTSLFSEFFEWKKAAPILDKTNDALWVLVPYEVGNNKHEVLASEIGTFLKSVLKIPTIGIISIHTRIGLLAGINVEGKGLGTQSGEQIIRYFSGEKIDQIKIENVRAMSLEINEAEAKRLNLFIPPDLLGFAHFVKDN